jgi:hypothetical protein
MFSFGSEGAVARAPISADPTANRMTMRKAAILLDLNMTSSNRSEHKRTSTTRNTRIRTGAAGQNDRLHHYP